MGKNAFLYFIGIKYAVPRRCRIFSNKETKKRENKSVICSLGEFINDAFACAKVMLFATLIMMLRAYARNDVMLAHCAGGTTSLPQATSQGEADIICPRANII
jgi:hypothetical protein